jgi:16S rRNA (adenine1518-N6/adenine1519-N6)-dimethyltransferase
VRSAVTQLSFRAPAVSLADERVFTEMVRSMFTQRRKTLSNALAPFATGYAQSAGEALQAAGIDGGRRAETLQLTELARLADQFAATKKRAVL